MTVPDPATDLDPVQAAWHPVLEHAAILAAPEIAHPTRLLGRDLVVTAQDPEGQTAAVLDGRCPHRHTALAGASVLDGCVSCPYHGWRFDRSGRCVSIPSMPDGPIPAAAHGQPHAAVVRDGLVWASRDPLADPALVPSFPTPASTELRLVAGAPMVWRTSAGRHLENILDLAHFPFVHPSTFGCPEAEVVAPHEVERSDCGIASSVRVTTRNPDTPDGPLYPGLGPLIELGYRYEVTLPYRITLKFAFPDGMRRELHEIITPVDRDECHIHWVLLVDPKLDSTDDEERAFAHAVFDEDRPIIESQPAGVPLAPTAEVHLPTDRLAVAYRRALREIGMPDDAHV